jgi:hypothetical protein
MHRVSTRTYVGQPNEMVRVTTQVTGGGQAEMRVNGVRFGAGGQFALPATPGTITGMQIGLIGPVGASCVVGITVVDGGQDGDFLVCQPHNPAPVNSYTFSVAQVSAVDAFAAIRGLKPASAKGKKKSGVSKKKRPKSGEKVGGK